MKVIISALFGCGRLIEGELWVLCLWSETDVATFVWYREQLNPKPLNNITRCHYKPTNESNIETNQHFVYSSVIGRFISFYYQ